MYVAAFFVSPFPSSTEPVKDTHEKRLAAEALLSTP